MHLFKFIRYMSSTEKVKASLFDMLSRNPKILYTSLTTQSSFKEIGLNSLDIVELLVDLEEELKIDLLDDEVTTINTCEEAIKIFTQHLDRRFNTKDDKLIQ